MTKSLTEKWKDGELPEGEYFAITTWSDEIHKLYFEGDYFLDTEVPLDNSVIVEVLAPVPSYDEYKKLQVQLKEANEVIKRYRRFETALVVKNGTLVGENPAIDYLKKWGVK